MTRIEATCPTCGPVERAPADFELAVCTHTPASYYAFTCPSCEQRIQKAAEERVIELLIAEGVRPSHWELPAEMLEEHNGPPLSMDDLLDLHLLLEREDWLDAMTQQT